MKPRVFVSSTYYDLKHLRERIERFIERYSYEAVLFESNNVIFEHDKPMDTSCYNEVKLCHMMVLIIGGRYGSSVPGENISEKKSVYNEYVSITRREYETALKMKMPIFIFIDKNVYAEYQTFKSNSTFFENTKALEESQFKFAHADDINVFKFINAIREKAIKTFDKAEDIENYLNSQLSGMVYLYLQNLQDKSKEEKVLDSVAELQSISKQMNEMLTAVGKNLIGDDKYQDVIFHQNTILIDFFVNQFSDNIAFQNEIGDFTDEEAEKVYSIFLETVFNNQFLDEIKQEEHWKKQFEKRAEIEVLLKTKLYEHNRNINMKHIDFYKISTNYYDKIYPIVKENQSLRELLDKRLILELKYKISGLPF